MINKKRGMLMSEKKIDYREIELVGEVQEETKTPFIVDNLDKANWVFAQIKSIKSQFAEEVAFYEQEKDRLEKWHSKKKQKCEDDIAYFANLLEEYVRRKRELNPNFIIDTPNGKASYGKEQFKFIKDEEKLLEYVERNAPTFIKTKKTVNWVELKKHIQVNENGNVFDENGEVIEGVSAEKYCNFNVKIRE